MHKLQAKTTHVQRRHSDNYMRKTTEDSMHATENRAMNAGNNDLQKVCRKRRAERGKHGKPQYARNRHARRKLSVSQRGRYVGGLNWGSLAISSRYARQGKGLDATCDGALTPKGWGSFMRKTTTYVRKIQYLMGHSRLELHSPIYGSNTCKLTLPKARAQGTLQIINPIAQEIQIIQTQ